MVKWHIDAPKETWLVVPPGARLPAYVRQTPLAPDVEPPSYMEFVAFAGWGVERTARLFVGEHPAEWSRPSPEYKAMRRYIEAAVIYGELPSESGGYFHALDSLLWAYGSGADIPEELRPFALRQGRWATKILSELWLAKEIWLVAEAVDQSRGFARERIATAIEPDECIAPDLYDHVGDLLERENLGVLRADGKLDVRRDDFLLIALREGFWLPPPLLEAAKALQRAIEALDPAETSDAQMEMDLSLPTNVRVVTAFYRLLAQYHKWIASESTHLDRDDSIRPFMAQVLGLDDSWIGSRSKHTVTYHWERGLHSRRGKADSRSASTLEPSPNSVRFSPWQRNQAMLNRTGDTVMKKTQLASTFEARPAPRPPRLLTPRQVWETYPAFSEGSLRWLLFHRSLSASP